MACLLTWPVTARSSSCSNSGETRSWVSCFGVPRFLVRDDSSETRQIATRKEWFPVLEWGTWRLRNDVSAEEDRRWKEQYPTWPRWSMRFSPLCVVTAQGMEIGEVERHLLSLVMAVGRAALEEFVAVKGTGYAGKEIVDAQGNRCPYVRDRSCAYRSIFGTVPIRRAYYHAAGSPGVFPLDGELNLPERGYSYVVQEFSSRLAVTMSYEDAQEILSSFFPVKMPIRSLESIVGDVCDEVDRFYEEKTPPEVCPEAVVTVATVDKKGIVIRKPHGDEAGPEAPPANPDKPGKKKMATVISTYVTPRHVRTADDIVQGGVGPREFRFQAQTSEQAYVGQPHRRSGKDGGPPEEGRGSAIAARQRAGLYPGRRAFSLGSGVRIFPHSLFRAGHLSRPGTPGKSRSLLP